MINTVMGDTIQKPGGDASVIRIHGKNKGIAATIDSSSHYCLAHPLSGGKQVVCEVLEKFSFCRFRAYCYY